MRYLALPAALGFDGHLNGVEFGMKCPFHRDTRPSFSINLNSGLWTCYSGCGGGNAPTLVRLVKDFGILEAEAFLLSLVIHEEIISVEADVPPPSARQFDVQRSVPQWFLDRGFSLKTASKHGLRYDAISAGLYIPVGTEGWVLRKAPGSTPKYLNSPGLERPYGPLLRGTKRGLVLTEGPLDALWAWEAGYPAMALLGGRVTDTVMQYIEWFDPEEVIIATDNDFPGQALARKLFPVLLSKGQRVTQAKFPDARKDIQELTHAELKVAIQERVCPLPAFTIPGDMLHSLSLVH